ncbi:adenosylcobinamide-phosphate synthase CbiB [Oceaniserpentilla sp. 4NH20-0058]
MWLYSVLPNTGQLIFEIFILYLAIGARSLAEHGQAVAKPLIQNNILDAREQLKMIVSRDTQHLNESQISTATVETITENTHDGVIGPIFWFLIFGVAGVLVFRLANTLDAMWGYKNIRYEYFGKFSARVDDVLGWPSARLTVLLFMIAAFLKGKRHGYWRVVKWGRSWYSPNAGPVMAAGAFALGVSLGGSAMYQGVLKSRPILGEGVAAQGRHIQQAIGLMYLSIMMLVVILFFIGAIQWLY